MSKLKEYDLTVGKWTVKDKPHRWYVSAFTHIVEGLGSPSHQILSTKFATKKEAIEWARSLTKDDIKSIVDGIHKKSLEHYQAQKAAPK